MDAKICFAILRPEYLENTTFENIYALYQFDNGLQELFFRNIYKIEKKMWSTVSYVFCELHGEQQSKYFDPENYNYTRRNQQEIHKLIQMLYKLANTNKEYEYLVYQRRGYQNVPLWVLMNALTLGQLSKMYSFLSLQVKSKVSQNFEFVNERLFSHKVYSEVSDTVLHQKLAIPKS